MATIILAADGTTLEIPDQIAANDADLKSALTPVYPDLANAKFERKTENGVMTVRVNKIAGTKGIEFPPQIQYPQGQTREQFLEQFPNNANWVVETEEMYGPFQRCAALRLTNGRGVLMTRFERGYNVVFINLANEPDKQEYPLNLSPEAMFGMIGLAHSLNDAATWGAQWDSFCDILATSGTTKVVG